MCSFYYGFDKLVLYPPTQNDGRCDNWRCLETFLRSVRSFECAHHRRTPCPSVKMIRRTALHSFKSYSRTSRNQPSSADGSWRASAGGSSTVVFELSPSGTRSHAHQDPKSVLSSPFSSLRFYFAQDKPTTCPSVKRIAEKFGRR